MSDENKPFAVRDRRHFTSDGEVRQPTDARGAEARPGPPRPQDPPRLSSPAATATQTPPVGFADFLLSLGAQASLLMAGMTPEGRPGTPDLDGARSIIAILEMLQEKTAGRRTPEEDRVLEELLYQLRMGYLERARVGGA